MSRPDAWLEVDEIAHSNAKRSGKALKQVDADVDASGFYLPEMGLVRACHEGELALREPLGFSQCSHALAERGSMYAIFHT